MIVTYSKIGSSSKTELFSTTQGNIVVEIETDRGSVIVDAQGNVRFNTEFDITILYKRNLEAKYVDFSVRVEEAEKSAHTPQEARPSPEASKKLSEFVNKQIPEEGWLLSSWYIDAIDGLSDETNL